MSIYRYHLEYHLSPKKTLFRHASEYRVTHPSFPETEREREREELSVAKKSLPRNGIIQLQNTPPSSENLSGGGGGGRQKNLTPEKSEHQLRLLKSYATTLARPSPCTRSTCERAACTGCTGFTDGGGSEGGERRKGRRREREKTGREDA